MRLVSIAWIVAAAGLATGASAQALIGVDFENPADGIFSPNNWNAITTATPATIPNLIDESGASTGFAFTLFNGSPFSATPDAATLPQHTQSLAGINDYYFATGTGRAEFRGLNPGDEYFVWVFGLRAFTMNNRVQVLGGDAAITFDQVSVAPNRLWVNGEEGDSSRTLGSFSVVQSANADGVIHFTFDIVPGGQAGWTIGGLAIQLVPAPGALALLGIGGVMAARRRR